MRVQTLPVVHVRGRRQAQIFDGAPGSFREISSSGPLAGHYFPAPNVFRFMWILLGGMLFLGLLLWWLVSGYLGVAFVIPALLTPIIVLALPTLRVVLLLRATIGFRVRNWPTWILEEPDVRTYARMRLRLRLRRSSPSTREVARVLQENFQGTLGELVQASTHLT